MLKMQDKIIMRKRQLQQRQLQQRQLQQRQLQQRQLQQRQLEKRQLEKRQLEQQEKKIQEDYIKYTNLNKINTQKICFITCIIGDNIESVDKVTQFKKHSNYDYYLFTNLDKNLFNTSWEVLTIENKYIEKEKNNIYKSRYMKFMGWDYIKNVLKKEYDAIVYCDGQFYPKYNVSWENIVNKLSSSESRIVQSIHPHRGHKLYEECDAISRSKKDSHKNMAAMKKFLKDKKTPENIEMYENTVFCYDPSNVKLQQALKEFWDIYTTKKITHRDQPLWAYICWKHNIKPYIYNQLNNNNTLHKNLFDESCRGFNGHRYL